MVIMGRPDRAPTRASRRAITLGTSFLCAAALATTSAEALPSAGDPGKDNRNPSLSTRELTAYADGITGLKLQSTDADSARCGPHACQE